MPQFEKGDVVVLKSGGPKMTVTEMGDYSPMGSKDGIKCVWFEKIKGVQQQQEAVFDAAVLKKHEPSSGALYVSRG